MADNKFRPAKFLTFQKSQCKRPFIVIMTDVLVCQTEGFQAVWRFLHPFRNFQIMTHYHTHFTLVRASFPNFNFDYRCRDDKNDKNRKWG
jgi:hypothetical protein